MFIIWELVEFLVRLYIRLVVVLIKGLIYVLAAVFAAAAALMVWGAQETNKTVARRNARKALEREQQLNP